MALGEKLLFWEQKAGQNQSVVKSIDWVVVLSRTSQWPWANPLLPLNHNCLFYEIRVLWGWYELMYVELKAQCLLPSKYSVNVNYCHYNVDDEDDSDYDDLRRVRWNWFCVFVFELPVRVIYSLQLVGDLIDGFDLSRNNDPLSIGHFIKLLGKRNCLLIVVSMIVDHEK